MVVEVALRMTMVVVVAVKVAALHLKIAAAEIAVVVDQFDCTDLTASLEVAEAAAVTLSQEHDVAAEMSKHSVDD